MSACSSCGAPLRWARTPGGASMPIDRDPSDFGTIVLEAGGTCRVLSDAERATLPRGSLLYTSHFVTCPEAARHRARRGARR